MKNHNNIMGKFNYKTKLVWTNDRKMLLAFYTVSLASGVKLGVIPAGVDFMFRNKQFTTMKLLLLCRQKYSLEECKLSTPLQTSDWYDMQNGISFNKQLFMLMSSRG